MENVATQRQNHRLRRLPLLLSLYLEVIKADDTLLMVLDMVLLVKRTLVPQYLHILRG